MVIIRLPHYPVRLILNHPMHPTKDTWILSYLLLETVPPLPLGSLENECLTINRGVMVLSTTAGWCSDLVHNCEDIIEDKS